MKRLLAVVMSLVSVCAMADNERGFYVGVGMAEFMYDDETIDVSNARTAEILGGYKYNAALGVEVRYGTGVSEGKSKNDATAGRLKREIDSYYAVYYKPELINDEAKLYLLLGYMDMDGTETLHAPDGTATLQADFSQSGASYGIGVGFILNERFNFNVEYRTLPEHRNTETEIVSANFDYRF